MKLMNRYKTINGAIGTCMAGSVINDYVDIKETFPKDMPQMILVALEMENGSFEYWLSHQLVEVAE